MQRRNVLFRTLILLVTVVAIAALVGCESAGAGDDGDNGSSEEDSVGDSSDSDGGDSGSNPGDGSGSSGGSSGDDGDGTTGGDGGSYGTANVRFRNCTGDNTTYAGLRIAKGDYDGVDEVLASWSDIAPGETTSWKTIDAFPPDNLWGWNLEANEDGSGWGILWRDDMSRIRPLAGQECTVEVVGGVEAVKQFQVLNCGPEPTPASESGCDGTGSNTYDLLGTSVTLDLLAIQDDPNGSQNGKMVTLSDSADSLNFVAFGVFSGDTVVGTYDLASSRTLEPSTSVLGTVLMRADNETTAAMNVTESQYASIYGATPPTYGYITNGSLEITENSGVYTIVWSFTTNGGEAITGTYEGEIDFSS